MIGEPPDVLFLERGHEQLVAEVAPVRRAREGRAAGGDGRASGRPARVAEARLRRGPPVDRPAVVAAADQQVDLVLLVGAVLGRVPAPVDGMDRDTLGIAVAEAEDGGRPAGTRQDRVVGRNGAVAVEAQDLAVEARRVLRVVAARRVAHRDVQLAVATELEGTPVVHDRGAHPVAHDVPVERERRPGGHPVAQHLVAPCAAVRARGADIEVPVRRERRVQRECHRPRLPLGADARDRERAQERRAGSAARVDADPARPFGHEHPAVGRERDVPRVDQAGLHDRRADRGHGSAAGPTAPASAQMARASVTRSRAGRRRRGDMARRLSCDSRDPPARGRPTDDERSSMATMAADSTALFAAIEAGDLEAVRELIRDDPALAAARNADDLSAALAARYRNATDILDVLLAANPALDQYDAAGVGDTERLRVLLDADTSRLNELSADGMSVLHLAVFFGHPDTARVALDHGAEIHLRAVPFGTPMPLHSAVAGNHPAAVRVLLEAGANPNAVQTSGWRPLHSAAQHGNLEIVRLLLDAGADPNLRTDGGRAPADVADGPQKEAILAALAA